MSEQAYEQLTLFQEDSRASLFPWLESKKGKTTTVTSGRRCYELSESLRQLGLLVRTYLESCDLPPGEWCRIWSVKGITSSCLILKLRLSELRTDENGSHLLPTVTATEGEKGGPNQRDSSGRPGLQMAAVLWKTPTTPSGGTIRSEDISETGMSPDGKKRQITLEKQVRMSNLRLWPTPTARDCKGSNSMEHLTRESGNSNHVNQLANTVKLFPTPTRFDAECGDLAGKEYREGSRHAMKLIQAAKLNATPQARDFRTGQASRWEDTEHRSRNLNDQLATETSGQLNPTWVEWLMGFPIGWTDLDASEMP